MFLTRPFLEFCLKKQPFTIWNTFHSQEALLCKTFLVSLRLTMLRKILPSLSFPPPNSCKFYHGLLQTPAIPKRSTALCH